MSFRRAIAWTNSHPTATDTVVAAILLAVALPALWLGKTAGFRRPDVWAALLVVATVAPTAWRRRWPDLVLIAAGTASLLADIADYPWGFAWPAVLLAIYSFARHRRRRTDLWPAAIWLGEIGLHIPLASTRNDPGSLAGIVVLTAVAWVIGDGLRSRALERQQLLERAEQAEREREARARQAVTEERARIAREMHDVVSHALGVIVMQAAGAGRKRDLDVARAALASIEATGRQAFGEMRRLVGVLRDEGDDAELAPQPALDDLPELVQRLTDAGLDVSLAVTGVARELPSGAELSAYRIVQEALTNALKHATGAAAHVTLAWSAQGLDIDVHNDAPPNGWGRDADMIGSGGHGLVGMRERALLFGGRFTAGPCADGGFHVHATLPLTPAP